jgi:hypothetical protein
MILTAPNLSQTPYTQMGRFLLNGANAIANQLKDGAIEISHNKKFQENMVLWNIVSKEIYNNFQVAVDDSKNEIVKLKPIVHHKFFKLGITALTISLIAGSSYHPDLNLTENNNIINNINGTTQSTLKNSFKSIFHSKSEAFLKLINLTEGKTNKFILDNDGITTAFGWNPPHNSKAFNTEVAKHIGMSNAQIKVIQNISYDSKQKVQFVPKQLKHTILSDKQVNKSGVFMMKFYEKEFVKVLEMKAKQNNYSPAKAVEFYYHMPNNQQAVMIHMAYKLGEHGLSKYDHFFTDLTKYMKEPTNEKFKKIGVDFEYSYKSREGNRVHDHKVELTHSVFFNECAKDNNNLSQTNVLASIKSCHTLIDIKKSTKLAMK